MKIIYVHHAERERGNPPSQNDTITKLGIKDAKLAAKLIKNMKRWADIKCIYTSPFLRCAKTANIINKKLNLPIKFDDRLNEMGITGETWLDLQNRVRECLRDIVFTHDEKDTVICVTSGINVAPFISLANKQPPSEDTAKIIITSCSPLTFNIDKTCF